MIQNPFLLWKSVIFFHFRLTSSSLSARYTSFRFGFDSVYIIVNLIFLSSLNNVTLVESPSPHFRFVSFRFISFGTRSSFLVAREPPIHPAPTFVAHPPTLLREGGQGGERGGSA